MITLHTFGPNFGLPDPSPFVVKTECLLKLSGLPYVTKIGNLRGAPKGKLPYIDDGGLRIADSTFIRFHMESKHGVDFDKELSPREKGVAWSVDKMLEDHLYWLLIRERWMDDANFRKGPQRFFDSLPALFRPIIVPFIRRQVRRNLHGHGLGRHTISEQNQLSARAIAAVATVLGDKAYLCADRPCGADATAFAFIGSLLSAHFDSVMREQVLRHANLVAYCSRMQQRFFP